MGMVVVVVVAVVNVNVFVVVVVAALYVSIKAPFIDDVPVFSRSNLSKSHERSPIITISSH